MSLSWRQKYFGKLDGLLSNVMQRKVDNRINKNKEVSLYSSYVQSIRKFESVCTLWSIITFKAIETISAEIMGKTSGMQEPVCAYFELLSTQLLFYLMLLGC